ncbi:MAG: TIGR01459 family HAD-type hydrolase [Kiloniellales bacterium]
MAEISIYPGLRGLADRYDGFILDLWGVLHDGIEAFPQALDCLAELRRRGKRLVILSNAPRRVAAVVARNRELGIDPALTDGAMSSGEATWQHLKERPDAWYRALGRRCFHIGPERDWGLRDGLDYDFVPEVEQADFVLCTGADRPEDRVEDFEPLLQAALTRGLAMVCANPDLEVIRGGRREICAGAIAARYEALGGCVRSHGKPAREIFETCLDLLGVGRERIAAVGDSLRTDVAGARAAGIDALFVAGGIHGEALGIAPGALPEPARLAALCRAAGERPAAALPLLQW